jgi:hypothetical protein
LLAATFFAILALIAMLIANRSREQGEINH